MAGSAEPVAQRRYGLDGWAIRITLPNSGERIREWAPTKSELERKTRRLLAEDELGLPSSRSGRAAAAKLGAPWSYDELCERALAAHTGRPNTVATLRYCLNYSRPRFGSEPWRTIDPEEITDWVEELSERGLQPVTVRAAQKAMRQAYNFAVRKTWAEGNRANAVALVAYEPQPDPFESFAELFAIARQMPTPSLDRLVRFLATTGCRLQEATVARRCDLDLVAPGSFTIQHVWGGWREKEREGAKTAGSKATILLPNAALAVLAEIAPNGNPRQLLFPDERGEPHDYKALRAAWYPAIEAAREELYGELRAKLPASEREKFAELFMHARPPRQTRHSFATLALRAGVPLEQVSRYLRHSSVRTSELYYLKLVPQMQHTAVALLNEALPTLPPLTLAA